MSSSKPSDKTQEKLRTSTRGPVSSNQPKTETPTREYVDRLRRAKSPRKDDQERVATRDEMLKAKEDEMKKNLKIAKDSTPKETREITPDSKSQSRDVGSNKSEDTRKGEDLRRSQKSAKTFNVTSSDRLTSPDDKFNERRSSKRKTPEPSPVGTDGKKKERVKSIIMNVEEKKKKLTETEKSQDDVNKQIKELKKEIYQWMQKSGNEKIVWNNRSINQYQCAPLKRTEASDILDMVENLYGFDALKLVVDELDRLHTAKYEGQYDVRFLENSGETTKERRKSLKAFADDSKKKKVPLVL